MKIVALSVLIWLSTTATLQAQDKSRNTIWPNGLNAAAYTNMSVEHSTVHDRQILSPRLMIGAQVYRSGDLFSICLGYGKVGFYDGIQDLSDEETKFQFNYQGPNVSFELFPNGRVSADFTYWFEPEGKGVRKLSSEETAGRDEGDYRVRYGYNVEEIGFGVNFRFWDSLQATIGVGSRNIKWSSKITRNDETITDLSINEPSSGSESSTYIMIGLRGSQLIKL